MSRLPLLYLSVATLCLIGGIALGIVMGLNHDHSLAPVHAHLNLLGWVTLALMGLVLRAYPVLAESRTLAWTQFALAAVSCVATPAGIYLAIAHEFPGVAIAGSLGFLAAVVMFGVRLLMLAFAGMVRAEPAWHASHPADATVVLRAR